MFIRDIPNLNEFVLSSIGNTQLSGSSLRTIKFLIVSFMMRDILQLETKRTLKKTITSMMRKQKLISRLRTPTMKLNV